MFRVAQAPSAAQKVQWPVMNRADKETDPKETGPRDST